MLRVPCNISDEDLDRLFAVTPDDEVEAFTGYLKEIISKKGTFPDKISINMIAKRSGLGRTQLVRFPVNRRSLISVARAFELSLEETADLYAHCGLFLSPYRNSDKDFIFEKTDNLSKIDDNTLKFINTTEEISALFELIIEHDYENADASDEFVEIIKDIRSRFPASITKNADTEKIDQLLDRLCTAIHREASGYGWIVLEKKDPLTNTKNNAERTTLYEIAKVLDFDLEETEMLYRSYGYTLAPEYIKFDAFIIWLHDQDISKSSQAYLYKLVCSNRDFVKSGNWVCTKPDHQDIERLLCIKESHLKTKARIKPLEKEEPDF